MDQSRGNTSGPILNETQRQLTDLERENFDLKMRIYYLNNGKNKGATTDEEAERIVNILHDRDMTYEQLRAANAEAHNKVSELQAELALLKSRQEANETTYDHLLHKNQRLGSLQLEENLKRERQAAQAIAQHDAALIAKYEQEIERLSDIHNADASLISECADRVAELMKIVEAKNKEIEDKSDALVAAHRQNEVLADRLSKQEVLLIKNEAAHKSNAISSLARAILPPPAPPMDNSASYSSQQQWAYPNSSYSGNHMQQGQAHMMQSHTPSQQMRFNPMDASSRGIVPPENEVSGSSGSLRPAPRLGAPFMGSSGGREPSHYTMNTTMNTAMNTTMNTQNTWNGPMSSPQHTLDGYGVPIRRERPDERTSSLGSNTDDHGDTWRKEAQASSPASPSQQMFHDASRSVQFSSPTTSQRRPGGLSSGNVSNLAHDVFPADFDSKPKSVLFRELQSARLEIESLKEENRTLRDSVAADRALIKTQERTLEHVRASAEEITLLEAEEIARLESELERISDERDKWAASCKKHEAQVELMRQGRGLYDDMRNSTYRAFSSTTPHSSQRNVSPTRGRSPTRGVPNGIATSSGGKDRSNSPRRGAGMDSGSRRRNQSPVKSSVEGPSESAIVEMYRRRETELLDALEGVVKRCHELESQLS